MIVYLFLIFGIYLCRRNSAQIYNDMKTSFYFVVWILIYPLLGLIDNQFVNRNSFLYGSLAISFGVKDTISLINPLRHKPSAINR